MFKVTFPHKSYESEEVEKIVTCIILNSNFDGDFRQVKEQMRQMKSGVIHLGYDCEVEVLPQAIETNESA